MTTERDLHLSDALVRLALTQDPPDGTAEMVWHDLTSMIAVTPQRRRKVIAWPWTPALPGVGASGRARRLQQVATLVSLAILVVMSIAAISIIGSLRRLPPPTGIARPGLIAYDSGGDIFVANPDGSGVRRVTSGPDWDVAPTWSQDGTRVAYQTVLDGYTGTQLNVIDADGSHPMTIATRPVTSSGRIYGQHWFRASWAPNGHVVALSRLVDGRTQIELVDVDGEGSTIIGDASLEGLNPVWSPDGTMIAFHGGRFDDERGVYVMDADGSNVRRLTTWRRDIDQTFSYLEPMWSPDSTHISYHIHLHENSSADGVWSSFQVWVVDVRDGTQRPMTDDVADNEYGTWSPDGSRFAYTRWIAGELPRFVLTDPDGTNAVMLPPAVRGMPTWSPDGSKLIGHAYIEGMPYDSAIAIVDVATRSVRIMEPTAPGRDGANEIAGDSSWQRLAD